MKRILSVFVLVSLLAAVVSSCDNSATYAAQLEDEMQSIKQYIADSSITVVNEVPTVVPWPDGVYYKTESGLYVHVLDTGVVVNKNLATNTPVYVRYNEFDMKGKPHYSNMESSSDPVELFYNNVSATASAGDCLAWHEGLKYVGDGGHIEMIVPASIGWPMYTSTSSLTAMYYELRYTFWK